MNARDTPILPETLNDISGRSFASSIALQALRATVFGQVTVNETMTARTISPDLRGRMSSE